MLLYFVFDDLYFIGCRFSFVLVCVFLLFVVSSTIADFDLLSTSRETGWEECLLYDLFSGSLSINSIHQ